MSGRRGNGPAAPRGIDRRTLLRRGVGVAAGGLLATRLLGSDGAEAADLPEGSPVRVALVVPGTTGSSVVESALFDIVGDAARVGASIADDEVARLADAAGHRYRLSFGHAPDAESARRAAERMVALEEATVLIGGLGYGQAQALAEVASERGVLFVNIGDADDRLRREGLRHVFHVEASNAMYLDALVDFHAARGRERWFLLHDEERLPEVARRAREAVDRLGRGGEVVGEAAVAFGQPVYPQELAAIHESGADVVLLAVEAQDEILLRHRIGSIGSVQAVAGLPSAVKQTRDFIAASRAPSQGGADDHRIVLWETTLSGDEAGTFNDRFTSRTGQPADPSGWAAHQAVRAVYAAAVEAGSAEPEALMTRMRGFAPPSLKGEGVSFRSWDGQLRQPLYAIRTDSDAPWGGRLSQRIAVARLEAMLPEVEDHEGEHPYDRYGDLPESDSP